MRIAFYAPLKPPNHPTPSGDRHMARLLMTALEAAGHRVELASTFRSRDGAGDGVRQRRLQATGARLARRLLRRYRARPARERPGAWFTYHLYYKAPDWLGPAVSAALDIPYIVAEASYAPKRDGGAWDLGHLAAGDAIRRADAVVGLNSHNAPCILPLLDDPAKWVPLSPFLDIRPFAAAAGARARHRVRVAAEFGLGPDRPLLLSVAMMRHDNKIDSYRLLAAALHRLDDLAWQLLVVGDGPARRAVEQAFGGLAPGRVRFAGLLPPERLAPVYAAADIFAWPAVTESYGMAMLEAQAAGLPVVAGTGRGVGDIVRDGETGVLVAGDGPAAYATALRALLLAPERCTAMGASAAKTVARFHTIEAAAAVLNQVLEAAARVTAR